MSLQPSRLITWKKKFTHLLFRKIFISSKSIRKNEEIISDAKKWKKKIDEIIEWLLIADHQLLFSRKWTSSAQKTYKHMTIKPVHDFNLCSKTAILTSFVWSLYSHQISMLSMDADRDFYGWVWLITLFMDECGSWTHSSIQSCFGEKAIHIQKTTLTYKNIVTWNYDYARFYFYNGFRSSM